MNVVTSPVTTKSLPAFVAESWTVTCSSEGEASTLNFSRSCALCCALAESSGASPAGLLLFDSDLGASGLVSTSALAFCCALTDLLLVQLLVLL